MLIKVSKCGFYHHSRNRGRLCVNSTTVAVLHGIHSVFGNGSVLGCYSYSCLRITTKSRSCSILYRLL